MIPTPSERAILNAFPDPIQRMDVLPTMNITEPIMGGIQVDPKPFFKPAVEFDNMGQPFEPIKPYDPNPLPDYRPDRGFLNNDNDPYRR